MKPVQKKLLGLLILFLCVLLPLGLTVGKAYRESRKYELNRAVIAAVKRNNEHAVISLLSQGADANARDLPPAGKGEAWRRLWDRLCGKPPEAVDAPTALFVALEPNLSVLYPPENAPLIKALLDAGADVNRADRDGYTPLIRAAQTGKRETARLLLEKGARPDARTVFGVTPLFLAAAYGDLPTVRILLAHGASVNLRTVQGKTALHKAAFDGSIEVVRLLLSNGSDVNAREDDGSTPLADAVIGLHAASVELLLTCGARVDTRDNIDRTPLSWAIARQNTQILKILTRAGAKQ